MARETQNVIAVECNCYHDFEFSKWVNILCDEQMKSIWVYVYQSTEVFEDALLDEGIQLANYFPDGICLSGVRAKFCTSFATVSRPHRQSIPWHQSQLTEGYFI